MRNARRAGRMSHQVGAYLGGIRTIEDVRKRCRIDDETGCWLWSLYVVNGRPQCCYTLPDGTRRKQSARRCVAELKAGRVLPPTVFAFAAAHCNEPTCANPAHTRTGNRTQANRATAKSARFLAGAARRSMKATICNRLVRAKITMEIAREIRGRTEPAHVLEREYPIKRSAISNIRAGKSWRETVSGASVFAWRTAA